MRDVRDGAVVGDVDVESSGTSVSALHYLLPCEPFPRTGRACSLDVPVRLVVHGRHIAVLHHAGFLGEVRLREGLVRAGLVSLTGSRLAKIGLRSQKGGMYMGLGDGLVALLGVVVDDKGEGERGWTNRVVARVSELLAHELVLPVGCLVLAAVFGHEAWDYERHGC